MQKAKLKIKSIFAVGSYHKKYIHKYVEIKGGENVALLFVEFPKKYLCWGYNSSVKQQEATYEELPCKDNPVKCA